MYSVLPAVTVCAYREHQRLQDEAQRLLKEVCSVRGVIFKWHCPLSVLCFLEFKIP